MQYKCKCGATLIDHYCSGCNTLNPEVKAYCPQCENHPMNPIPC